MSYDEFTSYVIFSYIFLCWLLPFPHTRCSWNRSIASIFSGWIFIINVMHREKAEVAGEPPTGYTIEMSHTGRLRIMWKCVSVWAQGTFLCISLVIHFDAYFFSCPFQLRRSLFGEIVVWLTTPPIALSFPQNRFIRENCVLYLPV